METFWQDFRYSVRALVKAPGLTIVAVSSLALGIGANTTIFTLISALFLNPLPVDDMSRLLAVYTTDETITGPLAGMTAISYPNYEDFRDDNDVFSGLAVYTLLPMPVAAVIDEEPEQINIQMVSGNYFEVLGLEPTLGRFFYADEDTTPGGHPLAVISHGLWRRRLAEDPNVVGRDVVMNGYGFTVVGVAPPGFQGVSVMGGPEIWVPTAMYRQVLAEQFLPWFKDRRALLMSAVGRLEPGIMIEQARSQIETIGRRLEQEYPEPNKKRGGAVLPLAQTTIFPGFRGPLMLGGGILMAVVGMVLLIACSNVANLLIARAAGRRKEIAVRLAMGAPRRRLMRQLLTESVLLGLTGGVLGLVVAYFGRDFIWSFRTVFVPANFLDLAINGHVLVFNMAVALATGVLFGLAPALQSSRPEVIDALKEEHRGGSGGRRGMTLRGVLVVAQVALSFVALVTAGIFLRDLDAAHQIDPGFETNQLATLTVNPGQNGYEKPRGEQYYRDILERVAALPETESVALSSNLPLFGGFPRTVYIEGQDTSGEDTGELTQSSTVGVGYFTTMGIPIVAGRDFTEADREEALPVAIINEEMAEKHWPGADPIGKRFRLYGFDFFYEVVGVTKTVKYVTLAEDPQAIYYVPLAQSYFDAIVVHIRSRGDAAQALKAADEVIREFDPGVPRTFPLTMREVIDQSLWASKIAAGLLAVLGALGLALAGVGLYGVLGYSVNQRTREIGIRMAIGAARHDVLRLVVRQAMTLVGIGIGVGLLVSFVVARAMASLLYGVSPMDPTTFVGVPLVLAGVAFLASCLPALRASRVDPVLALHNE